MFLTVEFFFSREGANASVAESLYYKPSQRFKKNQILSGKTLVWSLNFLFRDLCFSYASLLLSSNGRPEGKVKWAHMFWSCMVSARFDLSKAKLINLTDMINNSREPLPYCIRAPVILGSTWQAILDAVIQSLQVISSPSPFHLTTRIPPRNTFDVRDLI